MQFSRNPSEPGSSRDHARWYLHVCPPLRDVRNGERAHPTNKASVTIIFATRPRSSLFVWISEPILRAASWPHRRRQRGARPRRMSRDDEASPKSKMICQCPSMSYGYCMNTCARFRRFLSEDDAVTSVEYVVMLALIILVCLSAVSTVGGDVLNYWSNNSTKLETALP